MTTSALSPEGQVPIQSAIDKSRSIDFDEITKFAWEYNDDIRKVYAVASPCKSDSTNMKGIQLAIKNLQNAISKIQKFSNINSAVDALINESVEPGKTIKKVLDIATGDIAGYVKNIMGGVRGWVLNTVQDQAKKLLPFLFPSEMPSFITKLNEGTNLLSCAFAKIMRGLAGLVGDLLLGMIDKFINGPMCLVEDFVGGLLNQIMGPIQAAITAVNALLGSVTGGITGAIAGAVNIAGSLFNMLDFATGILNFFKCDDDKVCPDQHEITRAGAGVNNDAGGDPQGPPAGGTSSPSDGAATPGAISSGEAAGRGASDPVDYKTASSAYGDSIDQAYQEQQSGVASNPNDLNLF
jgi:predicted phage tail protein